MVRTRIAPSPTGYPHIGTVYQAWFDYAFAKKHGGEFLVRIEDTDRNRFVGGAEEVIFEAFDWFGIEEDESPRKPGEYGPYRQSERLDLYKQYAEKLVENGHAYYCNCTKERLDEVREAMQKKKDVPKYDRHCRDKGLSADDMKEGVYVVRMKIPDDREITVQDGLRGDIVFKSDVLDDQVIIKSDGYPTYHLAVVVDDHLMKVTHLLRGEEWISSAPKHVLLYEYFGWDAPLFFHTPLIRNPDKSKLSKRQGHTSVTWYQQQGFLPDAILNYLALMGWSHPEEKEIFSREEFIELFEFKDLKPLGPVLDLRKLEWMNGQYIMKMQNEDLADRLLAFYSDNNLDAELVKKTVPLIKERIKTLKDYWEIACFFFQAPIEYQKNISSETELLNAIAEKISTIDAWEAENIGEQLQNLASEKEVAFGKFFMTLRVAITGKKVTPPLNESMEILGKEECVRRLKNVII